MNELGQKTFQALCAHSESLEDLVLQSLEKPAFDHLGELCRCLSLRRLTLEASARAQSYQWETESKTAFQETIKWIKNCANLNTLDLTLIPNSNTTITEILNHPETRLGKLSLKVNELDDKVFLALASQQSLSILRFKIENSELLEEADERDGLFAHCVADCPSLVELDTNEVLSVNDVEMICAKIPGLAGIVLNAEVIGDEYLEPLSSLECLRSLQIFGPSCITVNGLLAFLARLTGHKDGNHERLGISISYQTMEQQFSVEDEMIIRKFLQDNFGGGFDISYGPDLDDLHESDFSD